MNETGIIICVALCMFFEGELVEHTYKESMAACLRAKRNEFKRFVDAAQPCERWARVTPIRRIQPPCHGGEACFLSSSH